MLDRLARRKVTFSGKLLDAHGVGCFLLVSREFTLSGNGLVLMG